MNTHLFECNEPEINNTYLSRGSLHKTIFKSKIQYLAKFFWSTVDILANSKFHQHYFRVVIVDKRIIQCTWPNKNKRSYETNQHGRLRRSADLP